MTVGETQSLMIELGLVSVRLKKVFLVSGGLYRLDIIQAVLLRKLAHVLITDEATAEELVASAPST